MADLITRLLLDTRGFNRNLKQTKKDLSGFKNSMGSIGKSVGKFAALAGVSITLGDALHTAMVKSMEFEKSLSSLRALTGVSTQELSYFKEEAIRLGSTTTQTASQVVEAFQLIGSQKAELLKNKEALTQVTESAIVLAEAAQIDVPTAAKALTGAMNQMGASAYRASDYINILAAASQQGSADIPYLNKAIEKAGGTANAVGIEFNELVAAIEAVAPKISEASEAGTNLRNIFLILEGSADQKLKPSVVGLGAALDNLAAKQMDATQLTKMFGRESVTAAMALLSQRDAYHQLKDGITGTNTAFEQQKINNDNLAGSIKGLESAWEGFTLSINNSNGVLKGTVDLLTKAVNGARTLLASRDQRMAEDNAEAGRAAVTESNKRIESDVKSGIGRKEAIDKEEQFTYAMFPNADKVDELKAAWEKAQAAYELACMVNVNGFDRDAAQVAGEAQKLYESAVKEKEVRESILENLKAQRAELVNASVETEKAAALKSAAQVDDTTGGPNAIAAEAKQAAEGSVAALDSKLKDLREQYMAATTDEARVAVMKTINELEARKAVISVTAKYTASGDVPGAPTGKGGQRDENGKSNLASMSGGLRPNDMKTFEHFIETGAGNDPQKFVDNLNAISSMMGTLGAASQNMSNQVVASMLNSAGAIIGMIAKLHALAIAEGTAGAAATPFPMSIGAIATIVSTIGSVFASLPKFADGGIVGGSSVFGDKLLARVNSGEMILNKSQQGRLLSLADGGGGVSHVSVDGEAKVKGETIYIALNNYVKRTGKKNIW